MYAVKEEKALRAFFAFCLFFWWVSDVSFFVDILKGSFDFPQ